MILVISRERHKRDTLYYTFNGEECILYPILENMGEQEIQEFKSIAERCNSVVFLYYDLRVAHLVKLLGNNIKSIDFSRIRFLETHMISDPNIKFLEYDADGNPTVIDRPENSLSVAEVFESLPSIEHIKFKNSLGLRNFYRVREGNIEFGMESMQAFKKLFMPYLRRLPNSLSSVDFSTCPSLMGLNESECNDLLFTLLHDRDITIEGVNMSMDLNSQYHSIRQSRGTLLAFRFAAQCNSRDGKVINKDTEAKNLPLDMARNLKSYLM